MAKGIGRKIAIIGSPGAGKSTLAIMLGTVTGIPVYHLDRLYWLPGWKERDRSEFDTMLSGILSKSSWIIDGNYQGTLEMRLEAADTVVYLDFGTLLCVFRVLKRVWKWNGKTRPDLGEGCAEKFVPKFMGSVWIFRIKHRLEILNILQSYQENRTVFVFRNPGEVERFLVTVNRIK